MVFLTALVLTIASMFVRTRLIVIPVLAGVFWYLFAYGSAETLYVMSGSTNPTTKIVQSGDPGTAGQVAMIWGCTAIGLILHLYSLAYVFTGRRFGENV